MSDEGKRNGNEKVARLLDRAKNLGGNRDKRSEVEDEPLELDVDDPTREQQTPPTLTPEYEMELEEPDDGGEEKKGGFLARMSMVQRVMLVGVVAVAVIGFQKFSSGGGDKLAYLDAPQESPASPVQPQSEPAQEASSPVDATASNDGGGFEPIAQGAVTPDSNAIDLTPGASEDSGENAFALDPLSPDVAQQQAGQLPNPEIAQSGETSDQPNDGAPADMGFDDGLGESDVAQEDVVMSNQPLGSMTLDGEFIPPPAGRDASVFGGSSVGSASGEIDDIKSQLDRLNSDLSSLSQSVASIKGQVSDSVKTNEGLRKDVRMLMSELKVRDAKVKALGDRPEISDLVIFRAASNCTTCVPHALFAWQGQDVEVGDGLQWQGFDVAIRGDRLSLIRDNDVHHYWYR